MFGNASRKHGPEGSDRELGIVVAPAAQAHGFGRFLRSDSSKRVRAEVCTVVRKLQCERSGGRPAGKVPNQPFAVLSAAYMANSSGQASTEVLF